MVKISENIAKSLLLAIFQLSYEKNIKIGWHLDTNIGICERDEYVVFRHDNEYYVVSAPKEYNEEWLPNNLEERGAVTDFLIDFYLWKKRGEIYNNNSHEWALDNNILWQTPKEEKVCLLIFKKNTLSTMVCKLESVKEQYPLIFKKIMSKENVI